MPNRLHYGDNLDVLRNQIGDETVDLIYLDPPFNSNANYNILFQSPTGSSADAQIEAFEDTWHWNDHAEDAFDQVARSGNTKAFDLLNAMRAFLGENDLMAYLTMMSVRLIELHRVLKSSGSLYLHCDPTVSHYLKALLDATFGPANFRSEIIWKRTGAHSAARRFGPVHDVILYYGKGSTIIWNALKQSYEPEYQSKFNKVDDLTGEAFQDVALTGPGTRKGASGMPWRGFDPTSIGRHWQPASYLYSKYTEMTGNDLSEFPFLERLDELDRVGLIYHSKRDGAPRYKQFLADAPGVALGDVWTDIAAINSQAQERLGYPTQKPIALLERIIAASSNEGDVILDPFCGCGTAVHAAQKLDRQWIGIDVTHLAITLIEKRLKSAFPSISFTVEGTPKDLASAIDLAERDKYQFQWWAVSLIDAMPFGGKKKGADGGIDGIIYFKPDGKKTEKALVSVKGGLNVGVQMIRDLHSAMEREKAPMGVFLTRSRPTSAMSKEAAAVGRMLSEATGKTYPRLQILTLEELLSGKRPEMPFVDPTAAFKKATREETSKQASFL